MTNTGDNSISTQSIEGQTGLTPISPKPKHEFWVDFVRVFAIVAVLVLHSSAPILYKFNTLPLKLVDWEHLRFSGQRVRPAFFHALRILAPQKN